MRFVRQTNFQKTATNVERIAIVFVQDGALNGDMEMDNRLIIGIF